MKLLCDVCENAVASLVCCADEAVLCSSCDSRVHAANKLASKHHRVPLVPETSEPAVCDICQERPSFFFCLEDRALLCRECDLSVHSANALTAKHRRFLLTGITVGTSLTAGTIQETCSALTSDKHTSATSPKDNAELSMKKQVMQDISMSVEKCSRDDGGMRTKANGNKLPSSPQIACSKSSPTPPPIDVTSLRSYTMTKDGTLSMASKTHSTTDHKSEVEPTPFTKPNSTTISIQRISAGQRAPFVAPVLSSIRSSLTREEAPSNGYIKNGSISNSRYSNTDNFSTNESVMMDVDASSPVEDDIVSDYLNSGIPGWRLDELLTDLVGACDSGRSLSPPKESNVPGFGLQEEHSWFAELDFMEEQELSPSQQETVALVPEMPSPPTHSGLGVPRGKSTCSAAQPWAYDYLFTGPDHLNEFSVVPDVNVGGQRSLPDSPTLPVRGVSLNKKRKFW